MSFGYHRISVLADPLGARRRAIEAMAGEEAAAPSHSGVVVSAETSRDVAAPALPVAPTDVGPPKMSRHQAQAHGFTGNACAECGSLQMVRNGTCEKCNSCGATTGCS